MGGGITPLQRCSQCILQPQSTGQSTLLNRLKYNRAFFHIIFFLSFPLFFFFFFLAGAV